MPNSASSVAIIIAACNAADTIARAVRSALAEPEAAEVIVVDDASTDNTAAAARGADDGSGRLKILVQPRNCGPSAARNRAIRESTAPWIGMLDADDFFLPGRLKRLLAFADRADFIADDIAQVAEDAVDGPRKSLLGLPIDKSTSKDPTSSSPLAGEVRRGVVSTGASLGPCGENPSPDPSRKGRGTLISFKEFVLSNVTDPKHPRGEMGFLKPLMRRAFLSQHTLTYRETMRLGEDYELYARALASGARFYLLPEAGYVAVMRPQSLSGRHTEEDLRLLRDCDHALGQMPGLGAADQAALRRHYLSVDCRLQWRLLINAVKKRDARAALATFAKPYPVPFYLLARLAEQACLRTAGMFKKRGHS